MWDAVEALLNDARAIQHDRQWVMRQQLGPACCRLVWLSMAELAGGLAGCSALTPIQRRCLLGQLHFLPELRLAALVAEQPGGGDDGDSGCIQHPEPGNEAGLPNEGLGSTPLTEDPDVLLALACGYSVETVVYLDALANLCSDASADQLDSGLQLVIRLLEVLQILVQAHARLDASNQQAEEESTTLVSDIGLCLVAADRAAARTPDADWPSQRAGRSDSAAGGAQLRPGRVRSELPVRRRGLLCRLCRLAPASAAACCRGLVDFLVGGGFFGRADRHSEELWRGLVGSVLPAYARCNPSSVPLLAQLLSAYEDMSPSRRPEVFAQLVESVGTGAHLWALLLLLNRRARLCSSSGGNGASHHRNSSDCQRAKTATPTASSSRRPGDADCQPRCRSRRTRRRQQLSSSSRSSSTVSAPALLAEFAVSEQLLACAGLIRYLLRRIDPASLGASSSAVSALPFLELDKAADEFGGDEYFGFDELDEELESALLPATAAAAELPAQLESPLNFPADLLAGMAEAENSAAAMTQLFEALQQQQGAIWPACAFEPSSGPSRRCRGVQFLRVVCGLLARPEPAVRRKALDLMLSKLTGLDRAGAVPLLRQSLLDCLAGVERELSGQSGGPHLRSRAGPPAGRLRAEAGAELLFGHRRLQFLPAATTAADIYRGFELRQQQQQQQLGIIRLCTAGVRRVSQAARHRGFCRWLPGSCRSFLPRLRPTVADQRPPGVVLLASFAFLQQQCTVTMVDLMVPYLAQLLPVTVELMLSAAEAALSAELGGPRRPSAQLLPALQDCLKPHQQQQPWLRAEHWARLLRLNLEMTEDDSDSADAAGSLADFEAELSDLFSSLLGSVFGSGEEDADGDSGTMMMQREQRDGLAACLAPLPPATRAMLLQSLQDWAAGSASREAAFHRLMAVALASQSGRVSGLAGLLCELDAPQHAAALLELPGADSQQPRPSRQLSRWLLACLAALFKAAGGSSGLGLDLLDSIGSLLVDRLAAAADPAERLLDCLAAYAQGSSEDEALLKPLVRRLCDRGCRHPDGSVRLASLRAIQRLLDCLGDVFIDSLAADCVPPLPSSPRTTAKRWSGWPSGCWPTSSSGPASARAVKNS
uniref:HEAT repeat-containing protein 1 n=1 Tax=Macrostomum lignano TaxID=282301 RepID=A0A1I8F1I8_9PLAT